MMSSLNKVILIGNLGRDPDVRRMNSGDAVVSFSLATTESWRDKQTGDRREKTEWHNVVIFNEGIAKVAEQYCKKGSKIYVEGQLRTRKWEKDGVERYTTEIVLEKFRGELRLLSGRSEGGGRDDDDPRESRQSANKPVSGGGGGGRAPIDDDIPFAPEWRG
ncbi:MAG: single-stranded DNA-binding protein [Beijerinckiaceae bacterium]